MNREKEDELPMMQVGFIDSICMPIYEVSSPCALYLTAVPRFTAVPLSIFHSRPLQCFRPS